MIRDILNYVGFQKENSVQKIKTVGDEFNELSLSVKNFSKLLKENSNKNIILKHYDQTDLTIIEFMNKVGRNTLYGQKAAKLSRSLSSHYNFFKENINLYLDEPIVSKIEETKEELKIDVDACFENLRTRLNEFKSKAEENTLSKSQVENKIIGFNYEIRQLIKISDKEKKLKLVNLRNKLVNFYKKKHVNSELNKMQNKVSEFNYSVENTSKLIDLPNKTEHIIIEINDNIIKAQKEFLSLKKELSSKKIRNKNKIISEVQTTYGNLNNNYTRHLENLSAKKQKISLNINAEKIKQNLFDPALNTLFSVYSILRESTVQKIKTKQEKARERSQVFISNTVKQLSKTLNNIDLYELYEAKKIFIDYYQIYEKMVAGTDYSLLVRSLLTDLESHINKLEDSEKTIKRRNALAEESFKLLKKANLKINNFNIEELKNVHDRTLEDYNKDSKYTLFGIKISSLLNSLNDKISDLSAKKSMQEKLAKDFLDEIDVVIASFENYSVGYLSKVLGRAEENYSKYYTTSKLNKNIEFSIQNLSNTLSLLNILISYVDRDIELTDRQRILVRGVLSKTYSQLFSLGSQMFFKLNSKIISGKLKNLLRLEIERKLMLEEVNNKIISLNLTANSHIRLLMNNLANNKPKSSEDLKVVFLNLLNKESIMDSESLNEIIVKLTEISNSLLPLRKKSLLELKIKLS